MPTILNPRNFNKKYFTGVDGKLGVDLDMFHVGEDAPRVLEAFHAMGCMVEIVDIFSITRAQIGKAIFKHETLPDEWPHYMNCSALVKWFYGRIGIWMPRYALHQSLMGREVRSEELQAGDLLFTPGSRRSYYFEDPQQAIGHVAIATSSESIIHMSSSKRHMAEDALDMFLEKKRLIKVIRVVESFSKLYTLTLPDRRRIETTLDLERHLLKALHQSAL